MKQENLELIRSIPLFSQMEEENFQNMVRGGFVQNFPPNVNLLNVGETPDFFYIMVKGKVELYAGWEGHETTMAMLFNRSTFILAATVTDGPYLMSARTYGPSTIIMIPSENIREAMRADQALAQAVILEMSGIYRALVRNTKDLKLRNTIERVANYLLKVYKRNGKQPSFRLSYEKRILASKLGMTPENFSRALGSMKDLGVSVQGEVVNIHEPEKLEKFAKPDPLVDKC